MFDRFPTTPLNLLTLPLSKIVLTDFTFTELRTETSSGTHCPFYLGMDNGKIFNVNAIELGPRAVGLKI